MLALSFLWEEKNYSEFIDELNVDLIISDNFSQLRKMPTVPFLESHTESVQIFVKKVQNCDTLNNWFILSVDIELDLVSGETMS